MHEGNVEFESLRPRLRVLQIIALALVAGVLLFLAIAVVLVQSGALGRHPAFGQPIISFVAVGYLLVQVPLWALLPTLLTRGQVTKIARGEWRPPGLEHATDSAKLLGALQFRTIIGTALLEGAGFLGIIAYLTEGQAWVLAVPGVVLVLMLATFPTTGRVRHWLEGQQLAIEELRQGR